MSRGLGKTQRTILALVAAHPDEAWNLTELCGLIYPSNMEPTRAQTNAVSRALRMTLPGRWTFGYFGGRGRWLFDAGNLDAVAERVHRLETFVLTYDELGETTLLLELSDDDTYDHDDSYTPVDQRPPKPEPVD
jgi:hypothetical protein